tara:strand:- start:42 stop:293 length:252 start_codon:yes stop_codon:yes gene_type:complete
MKKYIYTFIVVILCMSFTTSNIKKSDRLINAIDRLEEMRSFINEDVHKGWMDPETASIYNDIINDIEDDIIFVIKDNKEISKN